jgi:hypothetical protein
MPRNAFDLFGAGAYWAGTDLSSLGFLALSRLLNLFRISGFGFRV